MAESVGRKRAGLWVYAVLPAIVLNLGSGVIFGAYYASATQGQEGPGIFSQGQVYFVLYAFISVVEWAFFLSLLGRLRRSGRSASELIAPLGGLFRFRLVPALLVLLMLNALFGAYVFLVERAYGGWPRLGGWATWQRALMLCLVPLTAGICEELIWRGYVLGELVARRGRAWPAILLAALSFAAIHGIMPDRLVVTFLFGLAAGWYYLQEQHLVPLMVAHVVVDLWSFGLSLLAV